MRQTVCEIVRRMACLALIAAALQGAASAQSGSGFDLSWNTIAGGQVSQGGVFKLAGVLGQPAAGPKIEGSSFSLQPGFLQDSTYFPVPVKVSALSIE